MPDEIILRPRAGSLPDLQHRIADALAHCDELARTGVELIEIADVRRHLEGER